MKVEDVDFEALHEAIKLEWPEGLTDATLQQFIARYIGCKESGFKEPLVRMNQAGMASLNMRRKYHASYAVKQSLVVLINLGYLEINVDDIGYTIK